MQRLGPVFDAHYRDHGQLSVISLVSSVSAMPDERQRDAYRHFLSAHGPQIAHVAIVVEGQGFITSAIRGLVTGILLLARQSNQVHIAGSIEEVDGWLLAKHEASTGVALERGELSRVLAEARALASSSGRPTRDSL